MAKAKKFSAAHIPKHEEDYSRNWKDLKKKLETPHKPFDLIEKHNLIAKHKKEVNKIWFGSEKPSLSIHGFNKRKSFAHVHDVVSLDCEMVGIGKGGHESMIARVSIVNFDGICVYDKYVLPQEKVTDYRTSISGIRPEQKEVSDILKNKILVGHSVCHDLKMLCLSHPKKYIRDTAWYKPFRQLFGGKLPSLKLLASKLLNVTIQAGEHSSVRSKMSTKLCYKCNRPGHIGRDCMSSPRGGRGGYRNNRGGGGGGGMGMNREKCYKCNRTGHFARDCKEEQDHCYRCDGIGHIARDCQHSPDDRHYMKDFNQSEKKCYTCGRQGHISRECDQDERKCYMCGKFGHISRDCPEGGQSDERKCYKCGSPGHISRDCTESGAMEDDSSCYRCGQKGHMARNCPDNVNNKCYRCGGTGHFARECVDVAA